MRIIPAAPEPIFLVAAFARHSAKSGIQCLLLCP